MASSGREFGELDKLLFARTPEYLADIERLTAEQSEGVKDLEAGFVLSAFETIRVGDVPGLSLSSQKTLRDFIDQRQPHSVRVIGKRTFISIRRGAPAFVFERAGAVDIRDLVEATANDIMTLDMF